MNNHSHKLTVIILTLIITAAILCAGPDSYTYFVSNILSHSNNPTIVIDPGHGGYDPGKIGINNSYEKDINLSIALQLKKILENNEYNVVMTRSEDLDYSDLGNSSKKTNDLNHRIDIINETSADIVVSIHQNSFQDASVSGAQVFYYGFASSNSSSKMLADCIQSSLIENLDPSNHRTSKSNTSYYMLKKTSCTTVIVECGFLSNLTEAKNLNDPTYQNQTAQAIFQGIDDYYKNNQNSTSPN